MKYLRLIGMMTRYRAALVLVVFLLLGVFLQPSAFDFISVWEICLAAIMLVLVYINAACINDIADYKIDAINVKHHTDRPLVGGVYSRRDVIGLAIASAVAALLLSLIYVSAWISCIVVIALLINIFYSLPPFKISHRAVLTPFYLPLAYVAIPFLLAQALGDFRYMPAFYLASFYFLFVARISLKDFRDREGDRSNGKQTLILRYGKMLVCALSIGALTFGVGLLLIATNGKIALQLTLFSLYVCVFLIEIRLTKVTRLPDELHAIAQAARLGNAILLTLLGSLLLHSYDAPYDVEIVFYLMIAGIYGYMVWRYLIDKSNLLI